MYRWGGSRGWGEGLWVGGVPLPIFRAITTSDKCTTTHTHAHTHTLVQTTRGHTKTTTCTRKHRPHDPSQVVQLEKKKKGMSASVHSSVDVARKKPAAFIACNASPDPAWKAKNQQFSFNRSKRFSENVCHCKMCLHALLAHAGIHSLIAETTKIVYSTEYLVFVCLVNHNCKILSCREMSYIGANNIAFTSAADQQKMHTAVRRSSKPWALRVAPAAFFFHMPSNVMQRAPLHRHCPQDQYMCVRLYTIQQSKNKKYNKADRHGVSCPATSRRHSGCVEQTIRMAVTCKCIRQKKKERLQNTQKEKR